MAVISNHKAAGRLRVLRLLRAERGFELFDRGRIRFRPSRGEPLFFIRSESRPDLVHYVDPDPSAAAVRTTLSWGGWWGFASMLPPC